MRKVKCRIPSNSKHDQIHVWLAITHLMSSVAALLCYTHLYSNDILYRFELSGPLQTKGMCMYRYLRKKVGIGQLPPPAGPTQLSELAYKHQSSRGREKKSKWKEYRDCLLQFTTHKTKKKVNSVINLKCRLQLTILLEITP